MALNSLDCKIIMPAATEQITQRKKGGVGRMLRGMRDGIIFNRAPRCLVFAMLLPVKISYRHFLTLMSPSPALKEHGWSTPTKCGKVRWAFSAF